MLSPQNEITNMIKAPTKTENIVDFELAVPIVQWEFELQPQMKLSTLRVLSKHFKRCKIYNYINAHDTVCIHLFVVMLP